MISLRVWPNEAFMTFPVYFDSGHFERKFNHVSIKIAYGLFLFTPLFLVPALI